MFTIILLIAIVFVKEKEIKKELVNYLIVTLTIDVLSIPFVMSKI